MSTKLYSNNTTIILSIQNVLHIIYCQSRRQHTRTCEKMTISRAAVVVVVVVVVIIVVIETALCILQH
jgi:hypothetical protein